METLIKRACGLDVHQASITACIMRQGIQKQVKTFGTNTKDLEELKQWLNAHQITHVAMESTGVYWKPVFNILGEDFELLLVNARHVKHVPGRKTDVQDAEWLCKLLRAGLLQGSYIPEERIRQLRNLTRYQKKLQHQIQSEKNRIHKLLQDANVKLTSVLSDIFGKTGRKVLDDLSRGLTDAEQLSKHFEGVKRLAHTPAQAKVALQGRFGPYHQKLLSVQLAHIDFLTAQIADLESEVQQLIQTHYAQEHQLLQSIPGVKQKAASAIIAELGVEMSSFPSDKHLAAWAGLAPGQDQSGAKQRPARLRQGNNYLKTMLIECAWCAVRTKQTYLRSKYYSLIPRMGKKKALAAIAHKMLIACYHILKDKVQYKELGTDYLNEKKHDKLVKYHLKRLEKLGYKTQLEAT